MDIIQAILLFFIKYALRLEEQSDLIMALIFITGIFALPLWEYVSRRLGKRHAYAIGVAFWAIVQIALIAISPSVSFSIVAILCIFAGIGVSAAHVLPWAILPDAVEWDEYQTGERHEGVFYSLVTLMKKIASSVAIPLTALMLELTNYVPNAVEQPNSAVLGIRLLMGPIPAVLLAIAIIFALKYPLDKAQFSKIVEELEERREKK
jgi:GPH family glycoside/pentoside/hexuronide:cation symporter